MTLFNSTLFIFASAIALSSCQFTPRCTTASGPVPKNTPCIFPFIYGGITYLGCAGDPAGDKMSQRWCSTKVDAKGNHMEGTNHFGYCPTTCPSHYDIQAPQVTVTPHGVTAVPAVTPKPKVISTPSLPPKMRDGKSAKHITGIQEKDSPPILPSPVDPGVSHPSGYHPVQHHDYHHEKYYHDPCYGKGVCVPTAQCPSAFRGNGTQCYLGDYSVGLCCNAILENPEGAQFLERQSFEQSNGYNDFSRIPQAVVNYAAEMGARFADNVTSTLGNGARLRLEASGKSASFSHFRFQRQAPGVGRLSRLAIIGGAAGKMLRAQLLGPYASTIRFNFVGADIRGTRLEADCPALPKCAEEDKYRTFDGSCNNLQNTEWGRANTDVQRVLDNAYDDGVFLPRVSSSAATSLPSARTVSNAIVSTEEKPSSTFTALLMSFGQFIDHDVTHIPNARVGEDAAVDCCGQFNQELPQPGDLTMEEEIVCLPIRIPENDKFYAGKQKCINFVRSTTSPPTSCQPGPFEQVNQISHWLDNSNVYGSGGNDSVDVRRYTHGLLHADVQLNGEELLPDAGQNECRGKSHKCFLAGDLRVNEQPMLAAMHTIFLREHNRLARDLVRINPHWLKDDERIYQEARRIVVAQWQHIIYNEWLPLVLGEDFMQKFGLYPLSSGYSDDYSGDFDPRITNPFAAAAFRFGHSLIPENIHLVHKDENGDLVPDDVPLRDAFSDMDHLRTPGGVDALLRGSVIEKSERVDNHFVESIINHLFTDGNLGIDLIALNTQRGRDHGLPGYTQYRKLCNVGPATTFDDLATNVSPKNIERLKSAYQSVEDIDLFIGMAAEEPENALVGNTYRCLIADQFARLKKGDRYFYDLKEQSGSFTAEQLYEIRKSSMSRLICDNAHDIDEIQPLAFVLADERNPLFSCDDELGIPSLYLDYAWRDGEPKYKP